MADTPPCVTEDDVALYQRDGAVVLRNLLSPAEVAALRTAIDWNVAHPSALGGTASAAGDPGRFLEDFCNWQRIPAYRDVIFDSAIPAAAARLMRSGTARLYHDHLLVKEAGTRQRTPWHQDQPYYNIAGAQNVSFWLPVDPVAREATLEFVPGSHGGVWHMPTTFLTEQARWFPAGSLAEVPDVDADRAAHGVLGWALQPGDAVAFHMLTLHGSAGTAVRRRAFSVRVMGDDMRHAPREWRTSPPFDGLVDELPAGAPLDHALFPLIHPPP
jgi:ectoine hydroxylase-related dioxygenase (phytanoyl-CoA dioxygenase family)